MLAVGLRVDHTASAVEGGPGKCPEASTPGPADCRQSNFETRGLFGAGGDREGGATWGAAPGGGQGTSRVRPLQMFASPARTPAI